MYEKNNFFDADCCKLCGECLSRCPVLGYSPSRAKEEKERLNRAEPNEVLDKCTTCFSCDLYCPNECNPYELVLLRWNERYESRGLPAMARMVIPSDETSIWNRLYPLLPADEKEAIKNRRKIEGKSGKDILLTGCFSAFSPYLTMTPVLSELTPYGDERLWCTGGHIYQLGLLEVVEAIAQRAKRVFEELKPRKVVTMMAAEASMLNRILPEKFGINYDIEVMTLEQWLWERIERGKLKLDRKIKKRISFHDNCFSKSIGDELWQVARDIAVECGADVVEMKHNRENALCCGFGTAAGRFNILDLIEGGALRFREAEDAGAEWMVVYCAACYFILSVVKELIGSKVELYHLIELVDMAEGRKPPHRTRARAFDILSIMSANISRMLLSSDARKRFRIDLSQFDRNPDPARLNLAPDKLTGAYNRFYKSGLVQNRVTQAGLHRLVRLILQLRKGIADG